MSSKKAQLMIDTAVALDKELDDLLGDLGSPAGREEYVKAHRRKDGAIVLRRNEVAGLLQAIDEIALEQNEISSALSVLAIALRPLEYEGFSVVEAQAILCLVNSLANRSAVNDMRIRSLFSSATQPTIQ